MTTLTVCVPTPGSPLARHLAKGSAIVSVAETDEAGRFFSPEAVIYFEGNFHNGENLGTFCQKVAQAGGRLMVRYPTAARRTVSTEELIPVGVFDYDCKVFQLNRPDLVKAWEAGAGVFDQELQDPASIRVVLDVDVELQGVDVRTLKDRIDAGLRMAIGNGLLTGDLPSEVDAWRLEVR